MTDISVQNIVKAFEEDNNILDGLSFEISEGERVGLLGRNGAGKTTLFRVITGELTSDEGEVVMPKHKRVGMISQIPRFPQGYTAEDVLKTAHEHIYKMRERMEDLQQRMAIEPSDAVLREYDNIAAEFELNDGYELDRLRNTVANGLQIPQSQRAQEFDTLSGGEKTRINLARLILENTDILLLDEPTNHLDMTATEWLEEYLKKFKGTVLVISHDRYFLDQVVTRTIEIVDGKAEFYSGNYSFYVDEKQRRYEEQLRRYEKEQSEIKRLQDAADRLYQWGTGNKKLMQKSFAIQSRIERMRKTDRPVKERKIKAQFGEKEFHADEVMSIVGLTKSYGDKTLFSDVELEIKGGERIAIIGDNGTGKSTLLKILMKEESPDSGIVRIGPAVKSAYLPQIIKFKNPHRNILDTMLYDENYSPQAARNRLGAFKFSGEDVYRPVSELSGGEQSRLRLCILMKEDINLLILDEPTNHLDIISREWIEDAVEEYDEALLFVSHDRYFVQRFATRIWVLEDGKITDFRGTFEKYRAMREQRATQTVQPTKPERKEKPRPQQKSENPSSVRKRLAKTEREIAELEAQIAEIDNDMNRYHSDYEKLIELGERKQLAETTLEEKYADWETDSEKLSAITGEI